MKNCFLGLVVALFALVLSLPSTAVGEVIIEFEVPVTVAAVASNIRSVTVACVVDNDRGVAPAVSLSPGTSLNKTFKVQVPVSANVAFNTFADSRYSCRLVINGSFLGGSQVEGEAIRSVIAINPSADQSLVVNGSL